MSIKQIYKKPLSLAAQKLRGFNCDGDRPTPALFWNLQQHWLPQSQSKLQRDAIETFISSFSRRKQHMAAQHHRRKLENNPLQ